MEKIFYTLVIKKTKLLREGVWRKVSRYFNTSRSHFSNKKNNLDLHGLYSGLQYAQTNVGFVISVKKGQRK